MKQIYSIPEIRKFVSEKEIQEYADETGRTAQNVIPTKTNPETGEPIEVQADFYPQLELAIEDRDGMLIESKENRFFNLGTDISLNALDWEGLIEVKTDSMLSPTPELERQRKMELFNLLQPVIAQISLAIKTDVDTAISLAKPVYQLLEIQNEKPNLWLPDELIKAMENPEEYKAKQQEEMAKQQQATMEKEMMANEKAKTANSLFLPAEKTGGGQSPMVVPPSQVTNKVGETLANADKMGV